MSEAFPRGPATSAKQSPTSFPLIAIVDEPMDWVTMVTEPSLVSKSLIVSGMRSPFSSALTIRNCPGAADEARRGAYTFILQMLGVNISLLRIEYIFF